LGRTAKAVLGGDVVVADAFFTWAGAIVKVA
jgi:hypothetical protein